MSASAVGDAIEVHGTAIDKGKKRVRCKYCGKEVGGFNRLKHHLAAVGRDVVACTRVAEDVKSHMRDALLKKKKERLLKEVGRIEHPELPLKRNFAPASSKQRHCLLKLTHHTSAVEGNGGKEIDVGESSRVNKFSPKQSLRKGKNTLNRWIAQSTKWSNSSLCSAENIYAIVKERVKDESDWLAARCEAGLNAANIKLPFIQRMVDALSWCGSGQKVPDLKGMIRPEEVKDVLQHVEDVKHSWARTGCSILLDGWTDQRGRNLINFFVNCPLGIIFLRSADASDAAQDADTLFLLISSVIKEVGGKNVVQVVAHETTDCLEAVGQMIMCNYRPTFWTLCADYCINLILEKLEVLEHVKRVLSDAKAITRFIYSNALLVNLMKSHMQGRDLVRTSHLKSVAQFITLQNMVSERNNLISMFNSSTWNTSDWASNTKGENISTLVEDSSFWAAAADVLKITNPLIGILQQISGKDRSPMGFLYDCMDCAKEDIKRNLGGEEASYSPIWSLVDDVWDGDLHSALHALGYYLNPGFFYSSDFYVDAEVTNGLHQGMAKLADGVDPLTISLQLDEFRKAEGGFSGETAVDQRKKVSPDIWWLRHGGHCPELQSVAVKLLSQTCSGVSRYMLKKDITEQLHAERRTSREQRKFRDLEFLYYNHCLWHLPSSLRHNVHFSPDVLKPSDEWVVDNN